MQPAPTHAPILLEYAEYALLPSDGRIWELIEGDFIVNPAPVPFHQTISRRLQYALMTALENPGLAEIYDAPIDVILNRHNVVQPDLAVVSRARRHQVSDRGIEGPPDIVVEVLSRDRQHDEVLKRRVYEKCGVPEYWIVDGSAGTVDLLRLSSGAFERHAFLHATDVLQSPSFDGLISIPLGPVFSRAG